MSDIPDRSDAKAFAKYKYEVEMAHLDGKPIERESYGPPYGHRKPCPDPVWNWENNTYFIAEPKPTHVPYSFENAPEVLKVQRKDNGAAYVAHLANCHGYELPYGTQGSVSFEKLLRDFDQLSGEPCGTKVEGDVWPKYYRDRVGDVWRYDGNEKFALFKTQCGDVVSFDLSFSAVDKEWSLVEITATEAAKRTGGKL